MWETAATIMALLSTILVAVSAYVNHRTKRMLAEIAAMREEAYGFHQRAINLHRETLSVVEGQEAQLSFILAGGKYHD